MNFPEWVETPIDQPSTNRAQKRLAYIIRMVALKMIEDGSLTKFATFCGIDRASMHKHIAAGSFSAIMATEIERACGREVIRHEDLMRPLEIIAE